MNLSDARRITPELNGLDDEQAISFINENFYPNLDRGDIIQRLGYSPTAAEPKKGAGLMRTAGDMAIKGAQGIVGLGQSAVGLGSLATGGLIGEGARAVGYDPKRANEFLGEYLSEDQKAADASVAAEDSFLGAAGKTLTTPRALAGSIVQSLPGMIAGMGAASAVAGRIAAKAAATYGGIGTEAGALAAKAAIERAGGKLMAVGAGVEGAQSAGQIADTAQGDGRTYGEYAPAALAAGVGTAAIGFGAGKLMGDAATQIATGANTGLKGGMLARVGKGIISEGALEEMPQSAQEQYFTNIANGEQDSMKGVANAAGMGLVTGGVMGGAMGGLQRNQPAPQADVAPILDDVADIANIRTAQDEIAGRDAPADQQAAAFGALSPEQNRIAAQAEAQRRIDAETAFRTMPAATVEDIGNAETVDDAIAAAEAVVTPAPAMPEPAIAAEPQIIADPAAAQQEAEQSQREALKRESDLETIGSTIEASRANQTRSARMDMLDRVLSDDGIVGIKAKLARFAGDLQRTYSGTVTDPAITNEEWALARKHANATTGLNELDAPAPPAAPVRVTPNEMPLDLVREKAQAMPQQAAKASPLPAELHDLARTSKTAEQFWRGLNAMKVPLAGRGALTAGYKAFRKSMPAIEVDPVIAKSEDITGNAINKEWTEFAPESGTLGISRAEMPQIKSEHRGAMVNFLNARGIAHEQDEVSPVDLKATQREFSAGKVEKAKGFTGPDRSILISSDNHVLDGHHQWLAKRESGEPVKVIRLDAPIAKLLAEVAEFPSVQTAGGAEQQPVKAEPLAKVAEQERRQADEKAAERKQSEAERQAGIKKEVDARQAASAENFQLGQSAEESLSGQRDVFDAPMLSTKERDTGKGIPLPLFREVMVSHKVWIEDEGAYAVKELPASMVLPSVREDIKNLKALIKCMKG